MTAMSDINVTPLIDLAFALLIIFMITTPLLEQSIPLQLPVETQKPQPARDQIRFETISVNREGQVFWGDQPVTLARLDTILQNLSTEPDPPVLSIRADAALNYQKVIDVLDLIRRHQLTRISLDTQTQ